MDQNLTKAFAALMQAGDDNSTTEEDHSERISFDGFFKKGGAGRTIFTEHIVPYLSMGDLVSGLATCKQMNAMCRTYTVGEILELHSMDHVSREHKIELGKLVMGFVSPKYNEKSPNITGYHQQTNFSIRGMVPAVYDAENGNEVRLVHRRFVRNGEVGFWARLYHPSLMPEILLAMTAYFNRHAIPFDVGQDDYDWEANNDISLPLLVSATFGDRQRGVTDVTAVLRYLLMNQQNKRLVLKRPPMSFRYWHICLFGDPCPHVTKTLWIRTCSADGEENTLTFGEDSEIDMMLRAGPPGVAGNGDE